MKPVLTALAVIMALSPAMAAAGDGGNEAATARLLEQLRDDPLKLRMLLQEMPKGADLHNHLSGGPYAEEYLKWSAEQDLCLDTGALALRRPPCDPPATEPVKGLSLRDRALWNSAIDALSLRGRNQGVGENDRSKHDAFFSTFAKFGLVAETAVGPSIVSSARAAAADKALYLELIHSPSALFEGAASLTDIEWGSDDLDRSIDAAGDRLAGIAAQASHQMDMAEAEARKRLGCAMDAANAACSVTIRYLTYTPRNDEPEDTFRSLLASFAFAAADPRFVGVNIVGPEDEYNAVENYDEHMRMIRYLSRRFPDVKISLHAGELALGLAPAYALKDHIAKAVEIAGAARIGHGTDIAFEDGAPALLDEMAKKRIAVEINLTSNATLLGIEGKAHPIRLYLEHHVPITLSTDDQGVLRTDLTHEYVRAVYEQHLDYGQLKQAARNSLEYAFVPGASLWKAGHVGTAISQCDLGRKTVSAPCRAFLDGSEKARAQMALEQWFTAFEDWAAHEAF